MIRYIFTITIVALIACAPEIKHPNLNIVKSQLWIDSTQTLAYIDSAWWEEFNDPQLDSVVAQAFLKNYNLKTAAAALEAAEAQVSIAGSGLFPALSVGANGSRQKGNTSAFSGVFPGNSGLRSYHRNAYGISANIAWEIDLWGRISATRAAADAGFLASRADYEGARLSLAAQTIKSWFAAIEARKQYELADLNMKSYAYVRERIFARYEKGIRNSLDYRLTNTSLATAEYQLIQRKQMEEITLRQLQIILGSYPSAKMKVSETLTFELNDVPAGIPSDIMYRRPDIVAAERRLAAAGCNVWAAKAACFPTISLTGSTGTSTTDLNNLLDPDFSVWNLGTNILQPIFQGGRLAANVTLNEALQKQALAAYANVVLNAYSEIETILSNEQYYLAQQEALQIAANEAKASLELAEDRYYKGLINIITLLDARRTSNNAQSQLLTVKRQRIDNRIDFYVALGGGYKEQN